MGRKSLRLRLFPLVINITIIFVSGCINTQQQNQFITPPSENIEISLDAIQNKDVYKKITDKKFTNISDLQGDGHYSPYVRDFVSDVFGVVTLKRADGFYLQSVYPDNRQETSEGIFVLTNEIQKINRGDWVFVSGKVSEFYPGDISSGNLPITELDAQEIEIISNGNSLPEPVILGVGGRISPDKVIDDDQNKTFDLNDGLDFYESLESMLVQINDAICVGPSSSYKEFVVLGDKGINASGINSRGGITITATDFNPERIIVDDSLTSLPIVDVGDYFSKPIIGVVDYSFGNYKVQPFAKLEVVKGFLPIEVVKNNPNLLSVASMNVENLDITDPDTKFRQIATMIKINLNSPTIIALQEVQDNNGPLNDKETDATLTYRKLIKSILEINGPEYQFLDIPPVDDKDGGEEGGNIRVGYLIDKNAGIEISASNPGGPKDSVVLQKSDSGLSLNFNPGRIDPANYVFVDSRKSLILEFMYNGKIFFIINNHWNSKGEDSPLFGSSQPPILLSENQRKGQSKVIGKFVAEMLVSDPNANLIVLGDFNDFYFSEPLQFLEKNGLINLIFELQTNDRYTYNYEGNSQNLDNFFVSPNLKNSVKEFDIVHINSEFSYKTRFSDHDPIVVTFDIKPNQ